MSDDLEHGVIAACSVYVAGTSIGTLSSDSGDFLLAQVPSGKVELIAERVGYQRFSASRHLGPSEALRLDISLVQDVVPGRQIIVLGTEASSPPATVDAVHIDPLQIRQDAGAVGDVGRALLTLPSTGRVHDNASDLIVRGGSPLENSFYVDDIPVPNINHFPVQGSTAGAVTMFSGGLVADVSLQPGGFSAAHEDALSSVVDIRLREGSNSAGGSFDANLIGMSGIIEGALPDNRGSWLLGARRSHLNLLIDAINTPEIPSFVDAQGKLVYNVSASHSLTLLNLFADSKLTLTPERAYDRQSGEYGEFRAIQSVTGARWRWLWGQSGAATATLSYSRSAVRTSTSWMSSDVEYYRNKSDDRQVTGRAALMRIMGAHTLESGFVVSRMRSTEDFATAHFYSADGENILPMALDRSLWQTSAGVFLSDTWALSERHSVSFGLRADHSGLRDQIDLAPRVAASWTLHPRLTLRAAAGIYHQDAPSFLLMQIEHPEKLNALKATHEVIGLKWKAASWVDLSVDAYAKQYSHFPLDQSRPYLFVVDDATSLQGFLYYPGLDDNGRAKSNGVEFLASLRPTSTLQSSLALTLSDTRYRDGLGDWHERVFNTGSVAHITTNYSPSPGWMLNARWSFAGGAAYTPFSEQYSAWLGRGVPNISQINSANQPDYHALHLQVERAWTVRGSSIAGYIGVMNAYNRKNVAYYYWNYRDDVAQPQYQWGIMPVIGLRCEF